ncbi:hypothetical protein, partial [Streptomyces clavuligerus]
ARTGAGVGFDTAVLLDAVGRQSGIEALAGPGTALSTVTEPTETATAAAFAHTAVLAGRPGNAAPLAEAGRLFGRLAHLLDAVEDQGADARSGAWNPLTATGTSRAAARRLADDAVHGIRLALRDVRFIDDRLIHRLLAHEPAVSVRRAFGGTGCAHPPDVRMSDGGQGSGQGSHPYDGPHGGGLSGGSPGDGVPGGGSSSAGGTGGTGGSGGAASAPRQPEPRGFLAGCAAFTRLFCTCRICCAQEYEGPWSRRKREGCCRQYDCVENSCEGVCCPCN